MVFRRRLIFWLIRAYIQKWGKIIAISFIAGLLIFILLIFTSSKLLVYLPINKQEKIGLIGAYTPETLPDEIISKITVGLTRLSEDGSIEPGASSLWQIKNDGKTYIYRLRDDLKFSDGKKLDATEVSYNFKDVEKSVIDQNTISYTLKDKYAPFLVTTSRPIFKDNYVGLGDYEIQKIDLNSNFVKNVIIKSKSDKLTNYKYIFYPTEDSLKLGFILGELDKAEGLTNPNYENKNFKDFPNVEVTRYSNKSNLVTLFYNTRDSLLSDSNLRAGLTKALPNEFTQGKSNPIPYPVGSIYANKNYSSRSQDLEEAKDLVEVNNKDVKKVTIEIKTLDKYKKTAEEISKQWEKLGITTKIVVVDRLPIDYQVYLGDISLPRDPDQYILWHSTSPQNITRYKNLRIDKLLEDGRTTTDTKKRIELYKDFQKYLLDDAPAAFLFFPYQYTISKKGLFS